LRVGCPIRRSRDQRSLASPPGLSQRATPFIASQCQGIHQMPLLYSITPLSLPITAAQQNPPLTGTSPTSDVNVKTLFTSKTRTTRNPANIPVPRRHPSRSHSLFTLSKNPPMARMPPANCIFHQSCSLISSARLQEARNPELPSPLAVTRVTAVGAPQAEGLWWR
jgi:hypothetical protein